MRTRHLLLALLIGALAVPALAQRGESVYDRTFAFSPSDDLTVGTSSADVFVRAADVSEARVEVLGRGGDLRDGFERLNFSVDREGDVLRVRTERRGRWTMGRSPSFDIVVTVPARADAQIGTSSGDVEIRGLRGVVNVGTSSGDVELADVEGDGIEVSTSSGDIELRRVLAKDDASFSTSSGDVDADGLRAGTLSFSASSGDFDGDDVEADRFSASTSSGDIILGDVRGEANVNSSSGDVELRAVAGPLTVDTSSGDVEVRMTEAAPVAVSTGSGEVDLVLPEGMGADLDLRGGSIRIASDLGFRGETERRSARGALGSGGETVRVRSGSGRITLSSR